uniref:Uncharacterized protein n=1 Tax=Rhizophora mucronata TaxID=61149 RepID=A0A2P2M5X5_RHIMU
MLDAQMTHYDASFLSALETLSA